MSAYIEEIFENDLYKVKHIEGKNASASAKPSYHASKRLMFSYCIEGGGRIIIDSTRYEISDGDIYIIKPSEFFQQHIDDRCFHKRIVLIIDTKILKNLPNGYFSVLMSSFQRKNDAKSRVPSHIVKEYRLDKLFRELLGYLKGGSETENMLAFSRVLEIMATTNKIITEEQSYKAVNMITDSRMNDILKYLNDNFTKDISVTEVANHFNLDRAYISRLFKEQIGMGMWEYVIMRRIYLFNYLIEENNSIEETAYKVGFKNYSNFYRLYKKYMLITPIEFKKSLYNPND